ncbi:hypothetical protein GCM10027601_03090 [Nocardioides ungokensis]
MSPSRSFVQLVDERIVVTPDGRSAGTVMDSTDMVTPAAALGTVNVGPGMGQQ